jgi:5'-nucleotidase (lipoprotein e(P4) family)
MQRRIYIGIVVLLVVVIAYLANELMRQRSVVNDGKVWSSLYQQQAAEYRALCYQAYNIARERVDAAVKVHTDTPYAVITDIDETLLDNSRYDGLRALEDSDFRQSDWKSWTTKGIADTVPGAPAFFKYAASKGVAVFYITNRSLAERAGTLRNLLRYNLPDTANLVLQTDNNSSKEARRDIIMHGKHPYKVILLCGDNLPDFDKAYDNKPSLAQRKAATDKLMKLFGDRYIVIPNPEYNDWEGALYGFKYNTPDKEKDKIVVGMLNVDTAGRK